MTAGVQASLTNVLQRLRHHALLPKHIHLQSCVHEGLSLGRGATLSHTQLQYTILASRVSCHLLLPPGSGGRTKIKLAMHSFTSQASESPTALPASHVRTFRTQTVRFRWHSEAFNRWNLQKVLEKLMLHS